MKSRKKVFVALLSVACLTASAIAFAACGEKTADTRDPDIVAVYNLYVASADANGETPLSYEAWLESIKGAQGAQGNKGENGLSAYELYCLSLGADETPLSEEEWLASLKGDTGKGIAGVELNADGTKFVITYTDGTSDEVDAPKEFHVHTYGDDIVLIAPEPGKPGLGYHVCTEDGHIELVEISEDYKVTVKDTEGNLVKDLTLYLINLEDEFEILGEATTDANGVALFQSFGVRGNYAIITDEEEYVTVGIFTTDTKQNNYEITVALAPPVNGVSESGIYGINVGWYEEEWYGEVEYYADYIPVLFYGYEDKTTKYTITVDKEFGKWKADEYGWLDYDVDSKYEFYVAPNDVAVVYFSFDSWNYAIEDYPYYVGYAITVTKEVGPAFGSDLDMPFAMELGENSATVETEDGSAWFVLDGFAVGNTEVTITFGEGVTVEFYGFNYDNIKSETVTPETVTSGGTVTINEYVNNYFLITTTAADGEVSFEVDAYFAPGHQNNPVELTFGTEGSATASDSYTPVYFKYTATEDKDIFIEVTGGRMSSYYIGSSSNENEELPKAMAGFKLAVEAGTDYYFAISGDESDGTASVLIRAYIAATDKGASTDDRIEITLADGEAEENICLHSITYLTVKNLPEQEGELTITLVDSKGNNVSAKIRSTISDGTAAVTISGVNVDPDETYTVTVQFTETEADE